MSEMRRVLGVLRNGESGEGGVTEDREVAAPQPGLESVEELVERVRQAGLAVELRREGRAGSLPAGLDLSAFRIVQEALTNTLRHAAASSATVVLRYLDRTLEVEVHDDGRGPAPAAGSGGHGLVGLRERVALFGGELEAGPGEDGGFRVTARLPISP